MRRWETALRDNASDWGINGGTDGSEIIPRRNWAREFVVGLEGRRLSMRTLQQMREGGKCSRPLRSVSWAMSSCWMGFFEGHHAEDIEDIRMFGRSPMAERHIPERWPSPYTVERRATGISL